MAILQVTIPQSKVNTRIYDDVITTSAPPAITGVDFFLTAIQKKFYFKENNTVSEVTIDFLDNDCSYKIGCIYKVLTTTQSGGGSTNQ